MRLNFKTIIVGGIIFYAGPVGSRDDIGHRDSRGRTGTTVHGDH